jgi:hypothetical protein
MKTEDFLVLGIAGVAVYMILKSGGVKLPAIGGIRHGLRYTPSPGYGDLGRFAKYDQEKPVLQSNGTYWGIE